MSLMRLGLIIPEENPCSLIEKLNDTSVDHYDDHWIVIEPSHPPPVLLNAAELDDHWDVIEPSYHPPVTLNTAELDEITETFNFSLGNGADKKQSISTRNDEADKRSAGVEVVEVKQRKCSTCNAFVGDTKQYRDHFKREWHKHNLKRNTRQHTPLTPLTADKWLGDKAMGDAKLVWKSRHFKIRCSSYAEKL
ncbi:hypothetical protein MKX01_011818 [Papaver californicum]|nr:hypothetical protein MKX01_011818 [Papaver californicum]